MKLYPRCHGELDGVPIPKNVRVQGIAYTAKGYLLPCCWCDTLSDEEFSKIGMFDESLKLENNENVQDIIISRQWVQFHKTLLFNPENAPTVCRKICSSVLVENEFVG
jgi:hypothetical protein